MRVASYFVAGALLVLAPAAASAQGEKSVHVNLGGGPTFLGGDLGNAFSTGWGPAIGVTIDAPSHRVGFQFEYAYRWFHVNDDLPIAATRFSADHTTHQLDFNLVANLTAPSSPVRGYLVAGPGMYYRKVEITEYVGNGVVCNPWYYVCGTYPVEAILGSRGGWDFGFNIGGGVGFRLGESAEFFVETRYHYVMGPDIQPIATPKDTTAGGNANGQYWPLTFGFRF